MSKYDTIKSYASDSDDSENEQEIDVDNLPPLECGPGEHKLQYNYCLWYHRGSLTKFKSPMDYSKSLHFVGRCATVEQFWSLYSHLVRPSSLKPFRELHLFKSGIKPMWEDPCNAKGGKWVIRLRKNRIDRAWENVCMAMLGEQFLVGPEICGIVLSTRFPEDLLCVWNRTATDHGSTARIRDTLRRILNLPPNTPMEYKTHCDCLKYIKTTTTVPPSSSSQLSTLMSSSSASSSLSSSLSSTSSSSSSSTAAPSSSSAAGGVAGAVTSSTTTTSAPPGVGSPAMTTPTVVSVSTS